MGIPPITSKYTPLFWFSFVCQYSLCCNHIVCSITGYIYSRSTRHHGDFTHCWKGLHLSFIFDFQYHPSCNHNLHYLHWTSDSNLIVQYHMCCNHIGSLGLCEQDHSNIIAKYSLSNNESVITYFCFLLNCGPVHVCCLFYFIVKYDCHILSWIYWSHFLL